MKIRLALAALLIGSAGAQASEPPILADKVAAGKLPALADRLPEKPRVIDMKAVNREVGHYGGKLRMLMGRQKDIRMMTVYGYARLMCFNEKYQLVADILERYEVREGRVFTFHLRPGHKWSDGKPFTSEDFRYYWEDVANNKELSRGGVRAELKVDGKPPKFEVLGPHTVRYTWEKPNPLFLTALAAARPLYIYQPSHYLKQFHVKYQDKAKLDALVAESRLRDWSSLHTRLSRQYRPENPDLPTLQPWRNTTPPPAERFTFQRNPYYHRVDERGQQLPYIDEVVIQLSSNEIIPAKTSTGESDLQGRYIRFDDFTVLKQGEKKHNYKVRLWGTSSGSAFALIPNLNAKDDIWRKVLQDVRFRRALSLAVDREEINVVVFQGLAREAANSVLEQSPLYSEEAAEAWAQYDPDAANALLDEIGLTKRDENGVRLLPDGRSADIVVATAGESTQETDILELLGDQLSKVGLKLYSSPSQRDVFRTRIFNGETIMSVWSGLDNGVPTAQMSPFELAPTRRYQYQWSRWGLHFTSRGEQGTAPTLEPAKRLADLFGQWKVAQDDDTRTSIWTEMLQVFTDQVFTIGIVNDTKQPVVVSSFLRNVPKDGVWGFAPGAYFGIYMPDSFWFTEERRK